MDSVLDLRIIRSARQDPWYNLSIEERLMEFLPEDRGRQAAFLYLWQNERTVVIGRHQNAWAECRAMLLEQEGGKLARRGSGGGAVYHDLGNLNFSIILPRRLHHPARSSRMILDAVRSLGVDAELSGRNDILAGGLKFSGNAFQLIENSGLHHGTLLISTDFDKVSRYLSVPEVKLVAKGVASVRSRITNLSAMEPSVTVERACDALEHAFLREYSAGVEAPVLRENAHSYEDSALHVAMERHASWAWRYGRSLPFQASMERRFDWGIVRMEFQLKNGIVAEHSLYSDMLDPDLPSFLTGIFHGCRFEPAELAGKLYALSFNAKNDTPYGVSRSAMVRDIRQLILDQLV